MNKIDVKVNFEDPKNPKFYKKMGSKWTQINKTQFEKIVGHKF